MGLVRLLAQEGGPKNLWDPTILGVLVVLSAVGLFCGSVYLLLGTNLGARLGFLVAGACLTGFLVLLSSLWITTATPLNSPKGRPPGWKVKEVVASPEESKIAGGPQHRGGRHAGRRRGARAAPPGDRRRARDQGAGRQPGSRRCNRSRSSVAAPTT